MNDNGLRNISREKIVFCFHDHELKIHFPDTTDIH